MAERRPSKEPSTRKRQPTPRDREYHRLVHSLRLQQSRIPVLSRREATDQLAALLRRRNGRVYAVEVLAQNPQLHLSLLRHFGTFTRALSVHKAAATKWSAKRVIAELRRLHRQGVRTTRTGLREAGHRHVSHAARTYLGGLDRARAIAGIPKPRRRRPEQTWDEASVIEEIRELHADGKSIAYSKVPSALTSAAHTYFGGWRQAVEAAGFDYDQVRLIAASLDDAALLDEVRALARQHPTMTWTEFRWHRIGNGAVRRFGSIPKAMARAGIRDWPIRKSLPLPTPNEIIRLIRARARAGEPMYVVAVQAQASRLYNAANVRFGSWTAAVRAAGLEPVARRRHRWTPDEVLAALKERARRGQSLLPGVVQREQPGLYKVARVLFGSYAAAASRFGAVRGPRSPTSWSKQRVLDELKRCHKEGRSIEGSLKFMCRRYFGGVQKARRAAGVPQPPPKPHRWTREALIEELRRTHKQRGKVTQAVLASGVNKAITREFGSLAAARAAAGIPKPPLRWGRRWSRDAVVAELRRMQKKHGKQPIATHVMPDGLLRACRRYFGSLTAARKAAGIPA